MRARRENGDSRAGAQPPGGAVPLPGPALGLGITDAQYSKLAALVYRISGINLGEHKKELLKARLAKRLRATSVSDVAAYMGLLENDGSELTAFLEVITTNKTDFFREPQHFDFMSQVLLPEQAKHFPADGPLRIWSAACSTGEEPYTLAMILKDNRQHWERRGAGILASDINFQVINHAKNAVYATERVDRIPKEILRRHFQKGTKRWDGFVRIRQDLREMVSFQKINLMDQFHFDRSFHMIFCRNVMIYFDKATQERLVAKFVDTLAPGGYLFVGHSESLTGIQHDLKFVRPAIYRKG